MANAILGLRAETSIHAGTGQNVGAVDLPIQREAHTDWPCVFGSAMKGALRAHAEMRITPNAWITAVFGPESSKASDHAGALAVTDARLLLLPVRSLTGHFKWVTCPAVLKRLERDLRMLGKPLGFAVPNEPVAGAVATPCGGDSVFLEEFQFAQKKVDELENVISELTRFGIENSALENQLVVMRNDDFADFCRTATAVTPHIAIDNASKTVVGGALWYEETLPPDTLLYVMLLASAARNGTPPPLSDADVLGKITGMFAGENKPYLQIGGNETVGMGWCKVTEVQ